MKKLKLALDTLEVRSFAAENRAEPQATVVAMEATLAYTCGCTYQAGGCYPSYDCTGTTCVVTADYTCMTGSGSAC